MGHAHVDLVDAPRTRSLHQLIKHWDDRLAALERKALLAEIFLVKELFELFSFDQFLQQLQPRLRRKRYCVDELRPHLSTYPILLFLTLDVPVFNTYLSAIRAAKDIEDSPQREGFLAVQTAGYEFAVEVPNGQSEMLKVELRRVMSRHVQRIDIGKQMSAGAVGVDHLQHVRLLFGLLGEQVAQI